MRSRDRDIRTDVLFEKDCLRIFGDADKARTVLDGAILFLRRDPSASKCTQVDAGRDGPVRVFTTTRTPHFPAYDLFFEDNGSTIVLVGVDLSEADEP